MAPRKTHRRRNKGTGSVTFDTGRGKYIARLPDTGIGTPPKKQFDTEDAAQKWLEQRLRDTADGIAVDDIPTLAQWSDHWHKNIVKVGAGTHQEYSDTLRLRVIPYLGRFRLNELERNPERIEEWLALLEKKYAYFSVRNAFRLVRAMLDVAVARNKIRKNPTDTIKMRKYDDIEDQQRGYALSPEEAQRFLGVVATHRLYALYYVALRTGMRQAELIGLRWVNVVLDGDKPHIKVREQFRTVGKASSFTKPKTKHSVRDIPLDADLVAVLLQQRAGLADERQRMGGDWQEHLLVFPSSVGTALGANNLRTHFKGVLNKAKLPGIRFHDIRHSTGSLMLRNGSNLVDVSKLLGHSSIAITARIYIHSYEDTMRAAVSSTASALPARKAG